MNSNSSYYIFVIVAAILYGTITAGGQFFVNLGLSTFEISIFSIGLTALMLSIFVGFNPKYLIKKNMIFFFVIFGLVNALQELSQFSALYFGTPVAITAFLLYSQPIWTTIFGKIILKEQITKRKLIAVVIALVGVVVLVDAFNIKTIGSVTGFILALLGGIFLSLWIILGRKSGIDNQHYITTAFGAFVFTLLWLLILWPVTGFFVNNPGIIKIAMPSLTIWIYLIIFALLSGVLPHLLFYKGVYKVKASTAGIILLLEPISATILAAILFFQTIGLSLLIGGVFIIISNYFVISEEN